VGVERGGRRGGGAPQFSPATCGPPPTQKGGGIVESASAGTRKVHEWAPADASAKNRRQRGRGWDVNWTSLPPEAAQNNRAAERCPDMGDRTSEVHSGFGPPPRGEMGAGVKGQGKQVLPAPL